MAELMHAGRYLRLVREGPWEYCQRTNATAAVVVLAETPAGVIFVEQHRPPVGRRVVELPAGLAGDLGEEEFETAARRELEEETGWTADRLVHLSTGPSSAGLTDELIVLFRAEELRKIGPGGGDDSEEIIVHTVPRGQMMAWLRSREAAGLFIDPKVWAGLFWLTADLDAT